MLMYRRTSILDSSAQTLVNTVNCVGVMGKGLAKAFKERDPEMFAAYKSICERKLLEPGKLWLWQGSKSWVLNFPTKIHWRNPSKLEWIETGLRKFVAEHASRGIREISFPRLGCGNGSLDWNDVRPLMERYLIGLDIAIYIHDYEVDIGLPEHLEYVARRLQTEGVSANTFDSFLLSLRRAAEVSEGNLVELQTKIPFKASMDAEGNLTLLSQDAEWVVEREDLRGVWLSLASGLVTRAQAGWSRTEGANALLSLLSLIPQVRPIQIAEPYKFPELAVELIPLASRTSPVPDAGVQNQFAWA
jgi:O-acetyl-ADP-ribose deacetylase (regulator of RNase III)